MAKINYNPTATIKIATALVAVIAWFALALQLYLNIKNAPANGVTVALSIGNYFSYFTVLSNLLVAASLTITLLIPGSLCRFFSRPDTQTAIALYIFSVGIGYNVLLRGIWDPQGLQRVADESLHVIVPLCYVLYWFFFVPAGNLRWKKIPYWLIYPALYSAFALIRGSLDGFYPYPFVDVNKLGYSAVTLNLAGLLVALILFSFLFIAIGKWKAKNVKS